MSSLVKEGEREASDKESLETQEAISPQGIIYSASHASILRASIYGIILCVVSRVRHGTAGKRGVVASSEVPLPLRVARDVYASDRGLLSYAIQILLLLSPACSVSLSLSLYFLLLRSRSLRTCCVSRLKSPLPHFNRITIEERAPERESERASGKRRQWRCHATTDPEWRVWVTFPGVGGIGGKGVGLT